LNGVEQEKIRNGQTNTMQTDRTQNELYVKMGKKVHAIRRFVATSGGEINIEYSIFLGYMKIMDENDDK
jgi:hypothetical protein